MEVGLIAEMPTYAGGLGGLRMLRALGYQQVDRFHMNEGHSSRLVMELLQEQVRVAGRTVVSPEDVPTVRQRCIFTTHTPVPAGHDRFSVDAARRILGESPIFALQHLCCHDGMLNLTYLSHRMVEKYALKAYAV